jgi:hypothetical protein
MRYPLFWGVFRGGQAFFDPFEVKINVYGATMRSNFFVLSFFNVFWYFLLVTLFLFFSSYLSSYSSLHISLLILLVLYSSSSYSSLLIFILIYCCITDMHLKHTLGNGTKINGKTNVEKTPRKFQFGKKSAKVHHCLYSSTEQLQVALWTFMFIRYGLNNEKSLHTLPLQSVPFLSLHLYPSLFNPSPSSPESVWLLKLKE